MAFSCLPVCSGDIVVGGLRRRRVRVRVDRKKGESASKEQIWLRIQWIPLGNKVEMCAAVFRSPFFPRSRLRKEQKSSCRAAGAHPAFFDARPPACHAIRQKVQTLTLLINWTWWYYHSPAALTAKWAAALTAKRSSFFETSCSSLWETVQGSLLDADARPAKLSTHAATNHTSAKFGELESHACSSLFL